MGSFNKGFTDTFGPAFNQGQKASSEASLLRTKQKLAEETKIKDEDRLIKRQATKERAMYDNMNPNLTPEQKKAAYAFLDAGGTTEEYLKNQELYGQSKLTKQNQNASLIEGYIKNSQKGKEYGLNGSIPGEVGQAMQESGMNYQQFIQNTSGMTNQQRLTAWMNYKTTMGNSAVQAQNLKDTKVAAADAEITKLDKYDTETNQAFDDLNTFWGPELSTRPDTMNSMDILLDKISLGSVSKFKKMTPNKPTSDDKMFIKQVLREQDKPLEIQDYSKLIKSGKIRSERFDMFRKVLGLSSADALEKLNIKKKQVDSSTRQPNYTDNARRKLEKELGFR